MTADDLYNSISLNLVLLTFENDYHLWLKDKYKLFQSLIYLAEIKKNQYICHSGYWGLPALRSPVAPIAAPILSSSAGERGLRTNAESYITFGMWEFGSKSAFLCYVTLKFDGGP